MRNKRIEPHNVAGDGGPTDLLTKHSPGREKMRAPVKLYSCEFLDGRAGPAPKLRRSATTNVTMTPGAGTANVMRGTQSQEETGVIYDDDVPYRMPRTTLTQGQLDARLPAINAPDGGQLEDITKGGGDPRFCIFSQSTSNNSTQGARRQPQTSEGRSQQPRARSCTTNPSHHHATRRVTNRR